MRRKRFNTANSIRDEIDKSKRKFDQLIEQADTQERLGKDLEAKKLRIRARCIKDNQLDILKNKLAEFCTDLLPGVITDGDRSIPAASRKSQRKEQQ